MQRCLLIGLVIVSCLYGYWSELQLTNDLVLGNYLVEHQQTISVTIVEIIRDSPIQSLSIGQLKDINASILVKFPPSHAVQLGDTLEVSGNLTTTVPDHLASYYRLKRLVGTLEVVSISNVEHHFQLMHYFYSARRNLSRSLQLLLDYDTSALLSGILWGDTSFLPSTIKSDFLQAGLSHVMAISGSNMTLIAQILAYLLAFLPIRVRYMVTIICILSFCALVGMSAAVVRAGAMAIIGAFAVCGGRKYWAVRSFCVVVACFFMYNPSIVFYDVGFQLSCAATAGMIFLQPILLRGMKFVPWKYIRELVCTTVAASLVTLPITLYYFSFWYPLSIVINIILLPIIAIFSMLLYGSFLLLYVPFLGSMVAIVINKLVEYLLVLINTMAYFSSTLVITFSISQWMLFLYYSLLIFCCSDFGKGGIISRVNAYLGKG